MNKESSASGEESRRKKKFSSAALFLFLTFRQTVFMIQTET